MEDSWVKDQKVYYIEGGVVLKTRLKRRLEPGDVDGDYVLQNQKKTQGL